MWDLSLVDALIIALTIYGLLATFVALVAIEKMGNYASDVLDLEDQLNNVLSDPSPDNVLLVSHWYRMWASLSREPGSEHLIRGEN